MKAITAHTARAAMLLAGLMLASIGTASAAPLGFLRLEHGHSGGSLGGGRVTYDTASFDAYDQWFGQWLQCYASGDFTACHGLSKYFGFDLLVADVRLSIAGRTLGADDLNAWHFESTAWCGPNRCVAYNDTWISFGGGRDEPSVDWDCSGSDYDGDGAAFFLNSHSRWGACGDFYIGNAYAPGVGYWNSEDNHYRLFWYPTEANEPGSLALMGAGLLGLLVVRRLRSGAPGRR